MIKLYQYFLRVTYRIRQKRNNCLIEYSDKGLNIKKILGKKLNKISLKIYQKWHILRKKTETAFNKRLTLRQRRSAAYGVQFC